MGFYRGRMSALSRRLAAATSPGEIVESRLRNWLGLDARLTGTPGYQKVFDAIEKSCPLFLPVWVNHRSMLMACLRERHIETLAFGSFAHPLLPRAAFPETARLRDSVFRFTSNSRKPAWTGWRAVLPRCWNGTRNRLPLCVRYRVKQLAEYKAISNAT